MSETKKGPALFQKPQSDMYRSLESTERSDNRKHPGKPNNRSSLPVLMAVHKKLLNRCSQHNNIL